LNGVAQAVEVWRFDYNSRQHIKEIADWFQSSDVKLHSLLNADSENAATGRIDRRRSF